MEIRINRCAHDGGCSAHDGDNVVTIRINRCAHDGGCSAHDGDKVVTMDTEAALYLAWRYQCLIDEGRVYARFG